MATRSTSALPAAEQLMTVSEWAALIRVKRSTAYKLIADGQVEPTNVSTSAKGRPELRISPSAHADFVKRRTLAAPTSKRGRR